MNINMKDKRDSVSDQWVAWLILFPMLIIGILDTLREISGEAFYSLKNICYTYSKEEISAERLEILGEDKQGKLTP